MKTDARGESAIELTETARGENGVSSPIGNRKAYYPAYFAIYFEEDDVGPQWRNERRRWATEKTKRVEGEGGRDRKSVRARERKRSVAMLTCCSLD